MGTPVLRGAEANTPANSGGSAADVATSRVSAGVATGVSTDIDSPETALVAVTKASGNRNSSIIVPVVETEVTGKTLSSGKSPSVVRVKSSQVTIICIALLTMQIVSKQLYISLI